MSSDLWFLVKGVCVLSKKRILIMASGRGSNMEAILDAVQAGRINGEVVGVISSNPRAQALEKCRKRGIRSVVVDRKSFSTKSTWEEELLAVCSSFEPDLICLAGFMHILSSSFVNRFRGRIMNIHPSLLPSFPGLAAQRQAVEYGVKVSGCTVHFVDEGMDTGPIILQAAVPVKDGDDADTLAARILKEEHKLYPEAVRLFCEDRLRLEGRKVFKL
ncbi:MAG: phosphoribosylglycinamide formyltransferase [Firmicutes bacterium]|nr:phosphoribosylglycinamide formyltransferase [Bacillota bacterium]